VITDKDAERWLAQLESLGAELSLISARLKVISTDLDRIRSKLL